MPCVAGPQPKKMCTTETRRKQSQNRRARRGQRPQTEECIHRGDAEARRKTKSKRQTGGRRGGRGRREAKVPGYRRHGRFLVERPARGAGLRGRPQPEKMCTTGDTEENESEIQNRRAQRWQRTRNRKAAPSAASVPGGLGSRESSRRGGRGRGGAVPSWSGGAAKKRASAGWRRGAAGTTTVPRRELTTQSATLARECRNRWWGWNSSISARRWVPIGLPGQATSRRALPRPDNRTLCGSPRSAAGLAPARAAHHTLGLPEIARVYDSADGTWRLPAAPLRWPDPKNGLTPKGQRDTMAAFRARWDARWTASSV